jgi:hypothetical protein
VRFNTNTDWYSEEIDIIQYDDWNRVQAQNPLGAIAVMLPIPFLNIVMKILAFILLIWKMISLPGRKKSERGIGRNPVKSQMSPLTNRISLLPKLSIS